MPQFLHKLQSNLDYQFAKKHSAPKPVVTFKCITCYQQFPGFYALRQHKNTQKGFSIKIAKVYSDDIINEVDDMHRKEVLPSCQPFLVNSELERARHKIINYAVENLNETLVNEKLDHFSTIQNVVRK